MVGLLLLPPIANIPSPIIAPRMVTQYPSSRSARNASTTRTATPAMVRNQRRALSPEVPDIQFMTSRGSFMIGFYDGALRSRLTTIRACRVNLVSASVGEGLDGSGRMSGDDAFEVDGDMRRRAHQVDGDLAVVDLDERR